MQLKKAVESANPDIKVTGDEYPPTESAQMLATLISILQWTFCALVFFGEQLF